MDQRVRKDSTRAQYVEELLENVLDQKKESLLIDFSSTYDDALPRSGMPNPVDHRYEEIVIHDNRPRFLA